MNKFGAFVLVLAGIALAAGHVVWATWYSGVTIASERLHAYSAASPAPVAATREFRLSPDMNPVTIGLLAEVQAEPQKARQPGSAGFRVVIARAGREIAARDVRLAFTQPDAGPRTSVPTGALVATLPTPDEGVYAVTVTPTEPASSPLLTLGLEIRRNVAPISWAVVAAGLFLALVGVMGLRSRREA